MELKKPLKQNPTQFLLFKKMENNFQFFLFLDPERSALIQQDKTANELNCVALHVSMVFFNSY